MGAEEVEGGHAHLVGFKTTWPRSDAAMDGRTKTIDAVSTFAPMRFNPFSP